MNNLLQVIPIPIVNSGGGLTTEQVIALFVIFGVFVFLPSVIWLIIDWVKMKKNHRRCFVDWWEADAPFLPKGMFIIYVGMLVFVLLVSLALRLSELL